MIRIKRAVLIRILKLVKPYYVKLFFAVLCMFGAGVTAALPAWLMRHVVDGVLIRRDYLMLHLMVVALLILFVAKAVFTFGQKYLMGWVGQKVVMDMRIASYAHMQTLSLKFINSKRVGELLSRVTNDANMLQTTVTTVVVDLVVQGVSCISMLGYCLYLNWRLMIYTVLLLPLVIYIFKRTSKKLRRVGGTVQQQMAEMSAVAEEALSGIRIVRAFSTEDFELARFTEANHKNFQILLQGTMIRALLSGSVEVLLILALTIILWLGGLQVLNGSMTPGALVAFLGSLGFLAAPMNSFTNALAQLQYGFGAAERIFSLLDNDDRVVSPPNAIKLPRLKGEVTFDDVWFAYEENHWVLKGLNLKVAPGEKIAIVGATGAGKSTTVDLLQRFYDPQKGKICVDGNDVRVVDLKTLRTQIGVVPQDPALMKGAIAFNISYGYNATPEEIRHAAQIAGIADFIESLPKGYNAEVGTRGVTVSGGQRQRIAIARAIVRDPRIIILDEATSSLDAAVEHQIQEAMDNAMEGRTSFIIAHRLSTIVNADRIVYLEGGRIIEAGTHEELLAKKGAYQKLFALQYGGAVKP